MERVNIFTYVFLMENRFQEKLKQKIIKTKKNMHKSHPKKCKHYDMEKAGHALKYCEECDCVFCELCGKEWKQDATTWTYNPCSWANGTGSINNQDCTHKQN